MLKGIDPRIKRVLLIDRATDTIIGMFITQKDCFETFKCSRYLIDHLCEYDLTKKRKLPEWTKQYKLLYASQYEAKHNVIFQGGQVSLT